jgi:hypothetical protein
VAVSCEHGNDSSGSITCGEFLNKNSSTWGSLQSNEWQDGNWISTGNGVKRKGLGLFQDTIPPFLGGNEKHHENINQNYMFQGSNYKPGLPDYGAEILTIHNDI